jgi:hypothetical protein
MRSNFRWRPSQGPEASFSSETRLGISSSLLSAFLRRIPVPNREHDGDARPFGALCKRWPLRRNGTRHHAKKIFLSERTALLTSPVASVEKSRKARGKHAPNKRWKDLLVVWAPQASLNSEIPQIVISRKKRARWWCSSYTFGKRSQLQLTQQRQLHCGSQYIAIDLHCSLSLWISRGILTRCC